MKKFLALSLALVLALSLSAAAVADSSPVATEPSSSVAVVTPATAAAKKSTIPDELMDAAPSQADTVAAAVAALSAKNPVIAVAEAEGIPVVSEEKDEDGKYKAVGVIPVISMESVTIAAADKLLPAEKAAQLKADVLSVLDQEKDGAVISAYWFTTNEAAGDFQNPVNNLLNSEEIRGVKYTFVCNANGALPRVYLNGEQLEVTDNGDGSYTVYLFQEGDVVIAVNPAEE